MKPVGLADPRTGRIPYAAVQLRQENLRADSFNLVGFQNHLRFGEQERVFRLIPGWNRQSFCDWGRFIATRLSTRRVCCNPRCRRARMETFFSPDRFLEWKAMWSALPRVCWLDSTL